jgi:hypothetical protein
VKKEMKNVKDTALGKLPEVRPPIHIMKQDVNDRYLYTDSSTSGIGLAKAMML